MDFHINTFFTVIRPHLNLWGEGGLENRHHSEHKHHHYLISSQCNSNSALRTSSFKKSGQNLIIIKCRWWIYVFSLYNSLNFFVSLKFFINCWECRAPDRTERKETAWAGSGRTGHFLQVVLLAIWRQPLCLLPDLTLFLTPRSDGINNKLNRVYDQSWTRWASSSTHPTTLS